MDDLELLRAYAEHQSEEAFTELVERHVDLVYSTAVRIVPDADQDAIVLRYLENRSLREVGVALGLSEDTAQKRVSRALKRLQEFLLRRGVTVSLAMLASSLASHALQAASPGLAATVSAAALAAGPGGGVAAPVIHGWAMAKAPGAWIALSAALLLVPAGFATFSAFRSGERSPGPPRTNLVRNPGFEDGLAHWSETKGVLSPTSESAFSGGTAALVSERLAPYAGPIQHLPVEAMREGSQFECSARVRILDGPSQPVQITLRYDDAEGTHYLVGARGRAVADAWSAIQGRFTLNPSGALTFVDLFLEGPAPGVDFLVDDVMVETVK